MTKNAEMKWVITKGNENLSIKPLSSSATYGGRCGLQIRGSEFRVIRMGLDRQRVNHRKLDKRVRSLSETFQQLPLLSHYTYRKCRILTLMPVFTGGKGQYTQWVHCEFIVGSETIRLAHTQRVNGGDFQKVPTHLPSPNPAGK